MKKLFYYIIFYSIIVSNFYAQTITNSFAESFIQALINDSVNLRKLVYDNELKNSERLGISYFGIKNKFLISNDIDVVIRKDLQNKIADYSYNIEVLEGNYSKIIFKVPAYKIKREYFFYKSKLISKPFYFAKDWTEQKSKYFQFHISEPKFFNKYSQKKLDSFVGKILNLLKFTEYEINKLQKEKIHYYLCKDENEIELLTNYKARGLYYLPFDYIISTFNCHYHEILHLLINYKLQKNNLYTLPFLQEGFAVAYGGRGGKEPNVILETWVFLAVNNFIDYTQLLSRKDFYNFDASITYPYSGLFVKFLLETFGVDKFLRLYKKYSGNQLNIDSMKIAKSELPEKTLFIKYLTTKKNKNPVSVFVQENMNFQKPIYNTDSCSIYSGNNNYIFKLKEIVEIKNNNNFQYVSKLFNELFPEEKYKNQKYVITVDSNEVSVYNLFTNNLIAKYVKGFSFDNMPVLTKGNFFIFSINKKTFEEPLEDCIID